MNERDYSMLEIVSLVTGSMGLALWNIMMVMYDIPYTYPTLIMMFFGGTMMFFVCIVAYFKKCLLRYEMEQALKEGKDEMERSAVSKP